MIGIVQWKITGPSMKEHEKIWKYSRWLVFYFYITRMLEKALNHMQHQELWQTSSIGVSSRSFISPFINLNNTSTCKETNWNNADLINEKKKTILEYKEDLNLVSSGNTRVIFHYALNNNHSHYFICATVEVVHNTRIIWKCQSCGDIIVFF